VLEHDGNLTDACLLAMACALADTNLPTVQMGGEESDSFVSVEGDATARLALERPVFGITFGVLAGHLLVDPTADEEALLANSFTVLLDTAGTFCGLHKPGGAPLPDGVRQQSIEAAQERLPRLAALLAGAGSAGGVGFESS